MARQMPVVWTPDASQAQRCARRPLRGGHRTTSDTWFALSRQHAGNAIARCAADGTPGPTPGNVGRVRRLRVAMSPPDRSPGTATPWPMRPSPYRSAVDRQRPWRAPLARGNGAQQSRVRSGNGASARARDALPCRDHGNVSSETRWPTARSPNPSCDRSIIRSALRPSNALPITCGRRRRPSGSSAC